MSRDAQRMQAEGTVVGDYILWGLERVHSIERP
jgi:hypothetical protein